MNNIKYWVNYFEYDGLIHKSIDTYSSAINFSETSVYKECYLNVSEGYKKMAIKYIDGFYKMKELELYKSVIGDK